MKSLEVSSGEVPWNWSRLTYSSHSTQHNLCSGITVTY